MLRFVPLLEYIILLLVPELDIATNIDNSEDQQIDVQLLLIGANREVQLIPSGDVIILFSLPELEIPTNKFKSFDQTIESQF